MRVLLRAQELPVIRLQQEVHDEQMLPVHRRPDHQTSLQTVHHSADNHVLCVRSVGSAVSNSGIVLNSLIDWLIIDSIQTLFYPINTLIYF